MTSAETTSQSSDVTRPIPGPSGLPPPSRKHSSTLPSGSLAPLQEAKSAGASILSFAASSASAQPPVTTQPIIPVVVIQGSSLTLSTPADGTHEYRRGEFYALLDSASSASYVTENFLQQLPKTAFTVLKRDYEVSINTLNGKRSITTDVVDFTLRYSDGFCVSIQAIVVPSIAENYTSMCTHAQKDLLPHLKSVNIDTDLLDLQQKNASKTISLLLGMPVFWHFVQSVSRPLIKHPFYSDLFLLQTPVGTVLTGKVHTTCQCTANTLNFLTSNERLYQLLASMWRSENLSHDSDDSMTQEERVAFDYARKNLQYDAKEKRYTVRLLWKKGEPPNFPSTYASSIKRFKQMERALARDTPENISNVRNSIEEHIQSGRYQEIKRSEYPILTHPTYDKAYFLACRIVKRMDSETSPARYTFDCNMKAPRTGESLNSTQYKGAKMLKPMDTLLLRWRTGRYIFLCDLSRMFLNVNLDSRDHDYQIFPYRVPNSNDPIKLYRAKCLIFGSTSSPFLATLVLNTHMANLLKTSKDPEVLMACTHVLDNSYCDDVMGYASTLPEIKKLISGLEKALESASFLARKYKANHREILECVPPDKRAKSCLTTFGDIRPFSSENEILIEPGLTKALGMAFDAKDDTFYYGGLQSLQKKLQEKEAHTKRDLAGAAAVLGYDLTGARSPAALKCRILLQKVISDDNEKGLPNNNATWSRNLEPDIQKLFNEWLSGLHELDEVKIPRFLDLTLDYELHGFSDASNHGYAAVIFYRAYEPKTQKYIVQFVLGKARVRPLSKDMSIPKAELTAAALLADLFNTVVPEFKTPLDKVYCNTDSSAVYYWLKTEMSKLSPYQYNRVKKIKDAGLHNWAYCPSILNASDDGAKGLHCGQLKNSLWLNGPHYLSLPKSAWKTFDPLKVDKNHDIYVKGLRKGCTVECFSTTIESQKTCKGHFKTISDSPVILKIVASTHDWLKLMNRLAIILCLAQYWLNVKGKGVCKKGDKYKAKRIAINVKAGLKISDYMHRAKLLLLSFIQQVAFLDDFEKLFASEKIDRGSPLLKLNPFLFETQGIYLLRTSGRIENLPTASPFFKQPIILPKSLPTELANLVTILARHEHARLHHCTRDTLYFHLRLTYWIINGKELCRGIIHNCLRCNKDFATRNLGEIMAPLPEDRLSLDTGIFSSVSVDYSGPHTCKSQIWDTNTYTRTSVDKKVYFLYISCNASRYLNVIVCPSLRAEDFMLAMLKHAGHFRFPKIIRSDNFSSYKQSANELKEMFSRNMPKLDQFASKNGFRWVFSRPYSPWENGSAEISVKATKRAVNNLLQNYKPNFYEISCLTTFCLQFVNSRPLAGKGANSAEEISAITPRNLVFGSEISLLDFSDYPHVCKQSLQETWNRRVRQHRHFKQVFFRAYSDELFQRNKWHQSKNPIAVGDVVLVDEQLNKGHLPQKEWPLARVLAVEYGRDKLPRACKVQLGDGEYPIQAQKGPSVLKKPTEKIYSVRSLRRLEEMSRISKEIDSKTPANDANANSKGVTAVTMTTTLSKTSHYYESPSCSTRILYPSIKRRKHLKRMLAKGANKRLSQTSQKMH